jgi:hypothetical protein
VKVEAEMPDFLLDESGHGWVGGSVTRGQAISRFMQGLIGAGYSVRFTDFCAHRVYGRLVPRGASTKGWETEDFPRARRRGRHSVLGGDLRVRRKVIEDYYGTMLDVELVYKSAGPYVYVEFSGRELTASEVRNECTEGEFLRFTPEQARNVATQLNEAADEVDPREAA